MLRNIGMRICHREKLKNCTLFKVKNKKKEYLSSFVCWTVIFSDSRGFRKISIPFLVELLSEQVDNEYNVVLLEYRMYIPEDLLKRTLDLLCDNSILKSLIF